MNEAGFGKVPGTMEEYTKAVKQVKWLSSRSVKAIMMLQ